MKVIDATFDATVTGPATLTNQEITGDILATNTYDYIILNYDNVGAYITVQTLFTDPAPTYNIEVNLGMMVKSVDYNSTQGQMTVDPNGWTLMPQSIISPDITTALAFSFTAPFFAIRMNIGEAGTATGRIKVLQQGIR